MKVSLANNAEFIIKARSEADYEKALLVAEKMIENSGDALAIAAVCEYEWFVHLTTHWDNYQAQEFKDLYAVAKKEV